MSDLASEWKKAKTEGEKGLKEVLSADKGKVSGAPPKFKGDLQKTLDKFEASHDLVEKLQQKLEEEISKRKKLAQECQGIINDYKNEISKLTVSGPTSSGNSVGRWIRGLDSISRKITEKLVPPSDK